MWEYVAHMGPMLVLAGLMAGWTLHPTRHVSAMARCQTCGGELQDATQRSCGGDPGLHVSRS